MPHHALRNLPPEDLHTLRLLLSACTTQLLSRSLDELHSLPPAPMALLSQLTYCAASFARLGLDFHTLLLPLFEDAVRARVLDEFSRAVEEFLRMPESGWAAVGAPRGGAGMIGGVLHMPPQAMVVLYIP